MRRFAPRHHAASSNASSDLDWPTLLTSVELVDTAGLGRAFGHNTTEAALTWLPDAGAALVAVSKRSPRSRSGDLFPQSARMAASYTPRQRSLRPLELRVRAVRKKTPQRNTVVSTSAFSSRGRNDGGDLIPHDGKRN